MVVSLSEFLLRQNAAVEAAPTCSNVIISNQPSRSTGGAEVSSRCDISQAAYAGRGCRLAGLLQLTLRLVSVLAFKIWRIPEVGLPL